MPTIDLETDVRQIINYSDSSTAGNEGVDAILATIFKDVLEHEAGRKFTELLNASATEKVSEIEKTCNSNHQEFVDAVEKLLNVRKGAAGLRVQSSLRSNTPLNVVIELNMDMQKSGKALTSVMRQELETQTTLRNIDEAIDTLNVLLSLAGFLMLEMS